MGSSVSSFVDNIPIVWVVKKIIGSDSGSNSISVGQPLPDNPIIFIPKQGPSKGDTTRYRKPTCEYRGY